LYVSFRNLEKGKAFSYDGWLQTGPMPMKKVLLENGWCKKMTLSLHRIDPRTCKPDLRLLSSNSFNSLLPPRGLELLMQPKEKSWDYIMAQLKTSYAIHMFNSWNKETRIQLANGTSITEIVRAYCPVTGKVAGTEI
jgi:hypothetical protein